MKKLSSLVILSMTLVGCVDTRVKLPNGAEFTTKRFLWPGKIATASISTNGTMLLQGYQSDPERVIGAISAGVVDGLKKGAMIP
jgi:hypothetical protein